MSLKCLGFRSLGESESKYLQEKVCVCLKCWGFHSLSSGHGFFFEHFFESEEDCISFLNFLEG